MATATLIPIATQTLGSAAASITFSSIPSTYTDLRLVLTGTTSGAGDNLSIQFNADTATNYSGTYLAGNGSTASSPNYTSLTMFRVNNVLGTSTTIPTAWLIDVFSYAGSTNKTVLANSASDQNGSGVVELSVGLWRSTSVITSIKLLTTGGSNFSTGTIATLWGI